MTGRIVGSAIANSTNPVQTSAAGERQGPARQQGQDRRPAPTACAADYRTSSRSRSPAQDSLRPRDARCLHEAQHPRQELPISPCPAMLPCRRHVVAGGKLLDDLDVATPDRRARRSPRRDRGSASCCRERGPPAPPRRRRCRRCPCPSRSPRRTGPDRRPSTADE